LNLDKNLISIARQVLIQEAEALKNIAELINDDFSAIIDTILSSKGRVVVSGIGKSAIIGQKIVATLNSTGTPALFMHAADAIHGDLGMIQADDVVICISKSGNTPEVKVLVPLIKRNSCKLIALVGNVHSYLAQEADYVLDATVEKEADPNDLAPTTSTTAALALGDALAICLIEARNFSSEDFAKYHPGGSLGKRLYLKVEHVCTKQNLPIVSLTSNLKEIIVEISSKRLGATVVCDADNQLLGIITDGDLRRMMNAFENINNNILAKDIMTVNPIHIAADAYASEALKLMQEKNITQLLVLNEGKLLGILHLHDLIKEGIV